MLRIAHIGDLHFWRIPLNPMDYVNKRFLGVGNLVVGGRMRKFAQNRLPQLAAYVSQLKPDALFFSGDFTSTSLASEFAAARDLFDSLIPSTPLGAYSVPGNHDAYLNRPDSSAYFRKQIGTLFRPPTGLGTELLPENILLVSVDATTDNGMGSHGLITRDHEASLATALEDKVGQFRLILILCHFPPEDPPGVLPHDRGIQLRNSNRFLTQLEATGVPVVWLHGHHHYRWLYGSPTIKNLTYLNAGAPSIQRGGAKADLGFHLLEIESSTVVKIVTYFCRDGVWGSVENRLPEPGQYIDLQKNPSP